MKYLLLLIASLMNFQVVAQNFYTGYLKELNSSIATMKIPYQNNEAVLHLKHLFEKVSKETGTSFLNSDTLRMISYMELDRNYFQSSMLIWNKSNSCHYTYSYHTESSGGITDRVLYLEIDASKRVHDLRPQLKRWIEAADTGAFNEYKQLKSKTQQRKMDSLDINYLVKGDANHFGSEQGTMSFTVAIKTSKGWSFISSNTYLANL